MQEFLLHPIEAIFDHAGQLGQRHGALQIDSVVLGIAETHDARNLIALAPSGQLLPQLALLPLPTGLAQRTLQAGRQQPGLRTEDDILVGNAGGVHGQAAVWQSEAPVSWAGIDGQQELHHW